MDPDKVIIEPVLTEKANALRENNQFVFHVDSRANKIQVKSAIYRLFGVHPVACHIINVARKPKRVRYKPGFTASWKKAIVTLSPGETIGIFEGA
ncbi:MAG: 50S ribosomal protein L23 [Spirochaetota bacterium]